MPLQLKILSVCGRNWHGVTDGLIVSGSFQPDRYPNRGAWVAECFGDKTAIAKEDFS